MIIVMILSKVRDVDDGSPGDEDVSDYENKKSRKRARSGDFDDEISTSSDDELFLREMNFKSM